MFRSAAIIASLTATPLIAAEVNPLQVTSRLLVEQPASATTRGVLAPAKRAVPGGRVVVALDYRNAGAQSLANVVFDNPVPNGMRFHAVVPGSPAPELSVDGRTFGALAALRVPLADGGSRPATAGDVMHVRWRIPGAIAAGGRGRLSFEALLK